jgi:four helix bundle protein
MAMFGHEKRASLSVPLNTAEANGRRRGRQRAKAFDDARGSAIECAACLDAAVAKRVATADRVKPGKELLVRIVAMLSKLVERFDSDQYRSRESPWIQPCRSRTRTIRKAIRRKAVTPTRRYITPPA